ncbi:MAG TPA: hypothetical protein VNU48_06645 [Burkholderiaceae bacterium]|nr:hypothetical protein [Burkholderiaceae bacterium]
MRKLLALLRWPRASARTPPGGRGPKPRELMTDSDWVRHRAPPRHRDEQLSGDARAWLAELPEDFRPAALAERYPRIANRLAQLWRDPGLTEHLLDELVLPRRPGRQGFPPEVMVDLQSLQVLNDHRLYLSEDPDPREP